MLYAYNLATGDYRPLDPELTALVDVPDCDDPGQWIAEHQAEALDATRVEVLATVEQLRQAIGEYRARDETDDDYPVELPGTIEALCDRLDQSLGLDGFLGGMYYLHREAS